MQPNPELCGLLQVAGIETVGVFLNVNASFDSPQFRQECAARKIEADIAFNPSNTKPTQQYMYLDEELFKRRRALSRTSFAPVMIRKYFCRIF